MAATQDLARALYRRLVLELLAFFFPAMFLAAVLLPLDLRAALRATVFVGGPAAALLAGLSWLFVVPESERALGEVAGDNPGARLRRLFGLPLRLDQRLATAYLGTLVAASATAALLDGFSLVAVVPGLGIGVGTSLLLNLRLSLAAEQLLRGQAHAEWTRYPLARPDRAGHLSLRLARILPLAMVAALVAVAASTIFVERRMELRVAEQTHRQLTAAGQDALWPAIDEQTALARQETHALLLVFGLLAAGAAVATGVRLGRRYGEGSLELQKSVESLSSGTPRLPGYIAADELGDAAFALASVFDRLRQMALLLRQGSLQLAASAGQLSESTTRQNETLSRQAAALQETEVTAQEIKQTSLLASQKTAGVLELAERAEEISRNGELAVEQSLSGLSDIRSSVGDMASRIRSLGERARQIATITSTVKDLADQSNMLALNAAIEAVRSGEHGKGFSVVAREIRTLADQSIQATNRVREILQDISDAIRDTVVITERGAEKVQVSLVQVQSSGESLKALGSIVRDNAASVRQIAAAVGQQNAGIGEIFEAVKELSRMMDETLQRVQSSEEAANLVRGVAGEVSAVVRQYGVDTTDDAPPPPGDARAA